MQKSTYFECVQWIKARISTRNLKIFKYFKWKIPVKVVKIFTIAKFVEQRFRLPPWLASESRPRCEQLMGAVVVSLATFQPSTDVQQRPWAPHEGCFGREGWLYYLFGEYSRATRKLLRKIRSKFCSLSTKKENLISP